MEVDEQPNTPIIEVPQLEPQPCPQPEVAPVPAPDVLSADSDSDDDILSSGTSSCASDTEGRKPPKEEHKEPTEEKVLLMEMMDEFDDGPSMNSYAKFKTQNEVDPEQIEKYAPPIPELDDLDQIVDFGVVANYIDDGPFHSVCLVKPNDPRQIYDLDNIIALQSKEVIGYILDLVGHVTMPQYSVRLYSTFIERIKAKGVEVKNQLVDQRVYLKLQTHILKMRLNLINFKYRQK